MPGLKDKNWAADSAEMRSSRSDHHVVRSVIFIVYDVDEKAKIVLHGSVEIVN